MNSLSAKILSDVTVFTKYAKYIKEENRRETWEEIVNRNRDMHIKKYPFLKEEITSVYQDFVLTKKVLPSMRSMQFGGKPIELSNSRLFNCSYLPIDSIEAFHETMFLLLGGTGVGYSVQKQHVSKLPSIRKPSKRKRYLISDDIIGWSNAVKVLVKAYLAGKYLPEFIYTDIREKGALLNTTGGRAPGPAPLKTCLDKMQALFNTKENGSKLTTIEVHDLICFIADAVLSGGIRRAALIAGFDIHDEDMLKSKGNFPVTLLDEKRVNGCYEVLVNRHSNNKDYTLFISPEDHKILTQTTSLPWWYFEPQRGRANNSGVFVRHKARKKDFDSYWKVVKNSGCGEPGLYFSNNADWFTNPCITGDTLVAMADGRKAVRVDQLAEESRGVKKFPVYSAKAEGGRWETEVKQAVAFYTGDKETVKVALANGDFFVCTPDHRLALSEGGYVEAQNAAGKHLSKFQSFSQDLVAYQSVLVDAVTPTGKTEAVFDLTVEANHNFYIITSGDKGYENSQGVLIHNCAEIALRPFQFCNLTEINASTVQNQLDLNMRCRAASFIGTLQAGYTEFHYLRDIWQETTERDALLGVSMTGIASGRCDNLDLEAAAEVVVNENRRMAEIIGINAAARLTCVKPAGTTSLVMSSSSGIHAWIYKWYIRRMRLNKQESIYKYLARKIPQLLEDVQGSDLDAFIKIPMAAPEGALVAGDESALDFLNRVSHVGESWVRPGHQKGDNTHNVSATVYVREKEWKEVGEWMWKNRSLFNGLSVLPFDENTYVQAPHEEITEDEYNRMLGFLTQIDLAQVQEVDDKTSRAEELACAGGSCEWNAA